MTASSVHCALSDRAWTDLITNSALIPDLDEHADVHALMQIGGFPEEALAPFLHEAVHHWCFFSPVGTALAGLHLRARLRTLEAVVGGAVDEAPAAIEDIARYEAASALLRPIAEGLALFAEYDALPQSQTPVISAPMMSAYLSFTRPDPEEVQERFGASLTELLTRARRSEAFVRRKANLLLHPFRPEAGGYLPGYLMIKDLWRRARQADARLQDSDLLLLYLRRFFYADLGLVHALLQRDVVGPEAWAALSLHLDLRLHLIFEGDVREELDAFQAEVESRERRLDPVDEMKDRGVGPPVGNRKGGATALQELLAELEQERPGKEAETFRRIQCQSLAQRHILRILSARVVMVPIADDRVRVWRDGELLFSEVHLLEGPAREAVGMLDLYLSIKLSARIVALSIGRRVVALEVLGEIEDTLREQLVLYCLNRPEADKLDEQFSELPDLLVKSLGFEETFAALRRANLESVSDFTTRHALASIEDETERQACRDELDEAGFLPFVGDPARIRALAEESLAASLGDAVVPLELETEIPGGLREIL